MSKRGFTLVELLAVIFIIVLISSLVFVSISEKGEIYKDASYKEFEKTIITSAKKYVSDDVEIINSLKRGETIEVTIEELVNLKYLDIKSLKNPKTYKNINIKESKVEIIYGNYQYIYNVTLQ